VNDLSTDRRCRRFRAVGAYIFAGGFTLGVRQHFNGLCHLEEGSYGVATMRKNQPDIILELARDGGEFRLLSGSAQPAAADRM